MDFQRFRPHPWHGLPARHGELVNAYIEITPFSTIKYEVDKDSGYLMIDRPQPSNSLPPCPYGFVPRTYCGARVAALAGTASGDGDPLDVCVVSERAVDKSDILMRGRIVGGLLMVDRGEADDKLVAVLDRDALWGAVRDLGELPPALIERIRHYFLTYKLDPHGGQPVTVDHAYGVEHAAKVLAAAEADYVERFG